MPSEPAINRSSRGIEISKWSPYEEDTLEKYELLKARLREADYVYYSSKRIYDSVDELPRRYPMTIRYYEAMWKGELGFEKVLDVTSPPVLFGFTFPDQSADESWSLYDHARATLFRKTRDLSDAEFAAIFNRAWEQAVPYDRGEPPALSPVLDRLGLGSSPESQDRGLLNRIIRMVTSLNSILFGVLFSAIRVYLGNPCTILRMSNSGLLPNRNDSKHTQRTQDKKRTTQQRPDGTRLFGSTKQSRRPRNFAGKHKPIPAEIGASANQQTATHEN